MSPTFSIGVAVLALLAGAALGYLVGSSGRRKETERASALRAELDGYRREVTEHFSSTAALFQSIGAEYRKLYEHMATGAAELCEPGRSGRSLMFGPVERIARDAETDDGAPPRDYHVDDFDADEGDLSEIASAEPAADLVDEPTDAELAETEATEELMAERDIAADEGEAEKTLH
ncbi:MAG: DUF1043 family protein [Gammaproteobacteria bacterium]|nr:DUF1043 family protein [Gammaproteobacteria bacterium]